MSYSERLRQLVEPFHERPPDAQLEFVKNLRRAREVHKPRPKEIKASKRSVSKVKTLLTEFSPEQIAVLLKIGHEDV